MDKLSSYVLKSHATVRIEPMTLELVCLSTTCRNAGKINFENSKTKLFLGGHLSPDRVMNWFRNCYILLALAACESPASLADHLLTCSVSTCIDLSQVSPSPTMFNFVGTFPLGRIHCRKCKILVFFDSINVHAIFASSTTLNALFAFMDIGLKINKYS